MPTPDEYENEDDNDVASKFTNQGKIPKIVILVLVLETCERISYYSISANLLLFSQTQLQLTSSTAVIVVLAFSG